MKSSTELGRLAAIWRYPVKSLAGEGLTETRIECDGVPGDRVSALFAGSGHFRAGKTYEGIHDDRLHVFRRSEEAVAHAARRGVQVELRTGDGPYHFSLPISVIFDRWIAEVEAATGLSLDPRRWRPNLYARAGASFDFSERDLLGASINVGHAELRAVKVIKRCVVTTYDVHGGPSSPEVLDYVANERGNVMGVYCEVLSPGDVAIGDALRI